jgi:phosphonate transport system substrate-binding protein
MKKSIHLFLVGLALLYAAACARQEGAVGTLNTPLVMLLSPVYADHSTKEDRQALGLFLQKETGFTVDVRVAKDAAQAIEAFGGAGGADIGLLTLFEYLLAHEEYKVQAGLQILREGSTSYVGELVVKKGSLLNSLKDLAGRKLAYVDPYSSSGFVFPAQLLSKEQLEVSSSFAGSPEKALAQLKAGEVDAAAVYHGAATLDADLRVLATTAPIPNEPIFFRAGLAPEKKASLQAALIKFATTTEGVRILLALAGITGFRAATDAQYQEVSALISSSGKSITDLVQRGWEVNQPSVDLVP